MSLARPIALILPGSLAALLAAACGDTARPWQVDNVLLVTVDTLRADRVGAYGPGARTPRIDALAQRSLVFERAYSPATITHPAVSSMLTGLFPLRHGVNLQNGNLADGVVPLQVLLEAQGLTTASFVANLCKLQEEGRNVFHEGWDVRGCGMDFAVDQYLWDRSVVDSATAWLDERAAAPDERWFGWVHLMDPHAEHRPPPDLWDYEARPVLDKYEQYRVFNAWEEQRATPPAEDLRHMHELYAAEVVGADREIGRLLEHLDASPFAGRTAVIFTSDHGEELYETWSRYDHGLSLTDGVLWIPLLVHAPGLEPRRSADIVELLQVTPTVLDLLGLEAWHAFDGPSLLDAQPSRGFAVSSVADVALTIRTQTHRYWYRTSSEPYTRPPNDAPWRADAPWFRERQSLARFEPGSMTRYELIQPQAPENRELTEKLHRAFVHFRKGLGPVARGERNEDPELAAQLRALGY